MDNKAYQKYKYKVKIWETSFKKAYGRIPSKHDIHEADHEIREAYKMYFKLKSALLEETLMDISFDDIDTTKSADSTQQVQDDEACAEISVSEISHDTSEHQISKDITIAEPISQEISEFDKDNTSWNVEEHEGSKAVNVWGSHLNNKIKKEVKPVAEPKQKNTTVKLSQKLFKNSSFSKRNPRKSLSSQSFNKSDLNLSQQDSQNSQNSVTDSLPDIEQVLQSQASSQTFDTNDVMSLQQNMTKTKPLRLIDPGWLERCNLSNSFECRKQPDSGFNSLETSGFESGSKSNFLEQPTFGLRNIDISALKSLPIATDNKALDEDISELDDIIYNSESEDDSSAVKQVLKKRKMESSQCLNIMPESKKSSDPIANIDIPIHDTFLMNMETDRGNDSLADTSPKSDSNILQTSTNVNKPKLIYDIEKPAKETRPRVKRPARSGKAQTKVYKEIDEEEGEEEDPYAFDNDMENDPDFMIPKEKIEVAEAEEKPKVKRVRKRVPKIAADPEKRKVRKARVPKLEAAKKTKVQNFHKSLQARGRSAKKSRIEDTEDAAESLKQTEYELEFGIDTSASTVSRFGVQVDAELKGDLIEEFASAIGKNAKDIVGKSVKPAKTFDQDKLTKKAREKMNENFVRIDIKKKVFVRGKKPMNYSKYKKARWKERKAAALAGPDMDMGGCDGGLLKCFKCGHVGHFAGQCKTKLGDQLLPLEADVEVCPYPSLEEASAMANKSVLLAHANRPQTIPQAQNLPADDITSDTVETSTLMEHDHCEPEVLEDHKAEEIVEKEICSDIVEDQVEPSVSEPLLIESSRLDTAIQNKNDNNTLVSTNWKRHVIPEAFMNEMSKNADYKEQMTPMYDLNPDGSLIETPPEVYSILSMFGHKTFRPGQEKAVMRILSGQSTLVTLSTGSGKSLCYQLPAYLYAQTRPCITLVISPLVSLMEDQVTGVPDFLHATCLHTNQTPQQREKILEAVRQGMVNILLVSPEAVVSGERKTGFGALLRSLPPIAFACIDEVHCVSQWSHNFRPSYLMICQVLREKLGVKVVLGLTATATKQTRQSIIRHLEVPDGLNGIISDIPLPNNLNLSVSKDANRDRALIELLRSERFASLQSIIVYCTRRQECERIAGFIRTCMQDNKPPEERRKRKRSIMWNAEPYHAGMAASRRRTVQKAFMSGDLRIVVATVAFGMGINKSDIRAIIHYNMPRTFENYVQEVGRAGRDGLEAHCHLFLDSKGEDQSELKRHIYADSIDRHVIRKLLQRVFLPCKCVENSNSSQNKQIENSDSLKITVNEQKDIDLMKKLNWSDTSINGNEDDYNSSFEKPTSTRKRNCPGHEVAFSISETVQMLDIPEENISTLLCYLELHHNNYVHVLSSAYTTCQVTSYGGPKQLRLAAQNCPPLAMAIALDLKRGINHDNTSVLEFKVIDIAAAIGWDSGVVKYQLKQLEWSTVNGASKRSTLNVEFSDLGFRVRSAGDLTDDELDETLDMLYERTSRQERMALLQLQAVFKAMTSVAFDNCGQCSSLTLMQKRSDELKIIIREYFQREKEENLEFVTQENISSENQIIFDVRAMVANYPENNFTGRSLARIFYGIQSPNYPAVIWGRCRYWRAHLKEDFQRLITIANREIIKMR